MKNVVMFLCLSLFLVVISCDSIDDITNNPNYVSEDDINDSLDKIDSISDSTFNTLIAENTVIAVVRPLGDTTFNVKYNDAAGAEMRFWLEDSTSEGSLDDLHVGDDITFHIYSVGITETSDTAKSYNYFRPVIATLHDARYKSGRIGSDFTFEWIIDQPYWYPNGPDTIITNTPELVLPGLKKAMLNPYSIGVNIYAPTDTLMGSHSTLITAFFVMD